MDRLAAFIDYISTQTYPEPRSNGHDDITAKMAEEVSKLIDRNDCILDVGCGQGPALEWFNSHGFEQVWGITSNADDAKECAQRGFLVGNMDMHRMEWGDLQFGLVWARHVLEHSIAPFFVLHEFHRVLKQAGILYFEVPLPDTACRHEQNKNHYSVMGTQMWLNLIQRSGFEIVQAMELGLQTEAGPDSYLSIIARKL